MGAIWCASDLHLTAVEDPVFDRYTRFLDQVRADASELILLGDVFEAYLGDDDDDPLIGAVSLGLRRLVDAGVVVSFTRGNRDFLVSGGFAERCGARLLSEVEIRVHAGRRLALLHGDTLCTDDHAYQRARLQLRDAAWQAQFLAQPLAARRAFARQARAQSRAHTALAPELIMDVNAATVAAVHEHTDAQWIVHGHTHRPGIHRDGVRTRIVLGDWPRAASWLRLADDGRAELVYENRRETFCIA
jgi:UDP-2,3-diacylglucosamine hydrolase